MMNPLRKFSGWYFARDAMPYWFALIVDCIIVVFSGVVSIYITRGGQALFEDFWEWVLWWVLMLPTMWVGMRLFHTYTTILRYSSFVDLTRVVLALIVGFLVLNVYQGAGLPMPYGLQTTNSEEVIVFLLSAFLCWDMRIVIKYMFDTAFLSTKATNVFIYGVRQGGVSLAKSIRNEHPSRYQVKGFVDDEGVMVGAHLLGVRVYPVNPNLPAEMLQQGAKYLFVSPLCADQFVAQENLVDALMKAGIKILMMPKAETWDGHSDLNYSRLREVDIEDLLARDKIEVDMQAIGEMLQGKRILITGAAGSIGSEMVRQVAQFQPEQLILVDQAETPMHDVRRYMQQHHAELDCPTVVGNIANATHMQQLFQQYRPQYVFHAAAYKHVPMMEDNPAIAVQNNIYGTRVIADLAVKYGTQKFVMISTDKAVNPTNVMGCSKRICEIYCQSLNAHQTTTQFVTTRFGNVLGSNGSVIPIFREQIRKGGPVTVTHPEIIRYFMLIPEACRLVLEAGTLGKGGEIFVFDMGKPVRIADLAQRMIDLSGAQNVEIKFTGLRDGEKLYEEVLNDAEQTKPTVHPKIKVAAVREYAYEQALQHEEELYQLSFGYDDMAIVAKMKEIVPEYRSQHSKYEVLDKSIG